MMLYSAKWTGLSLRRNLTGLFEKGLGVSNEACPVGYEYESSESSPHQGPAPAATTTTNIPPRLCNPPRSAVEKDGAGTHEEEEYREGAAKAEDKEQRSAGCRRDILPGGPDGIGDCRGPRHRSCLDRWVFCPRDKGLRTSDGCPELLSAKGGASLLTCRAVAFTASVAMSFSSGMLQQTRRPRSVRLLSRNPNLLPKKI